jgi:hypothetical protein
MSKDIEELEALAERLEQDPESNGTASVVRRAIASAREGHAHENALREGR